MVTGYWIGRPDGMAFISALSPEGVGQVLEAATDWPAGAYEIRMHWHESGPGYEFDRVWGRAVKDGRGDVWIESLEDLASGENE